MSRKKNSNLLKIFFCLCSEPMVQQYDRKMVCRKCDRVYSNYYDEKGNHSAIFMHHDDDNINNTSEGKQCDIIDVPISDLKIKILI